jgi:hypothetical protein
MTLALTRNHSVYICIYTRTQKRTTNNFEWDRVLITHGFEAVGKRAGTDSAAAAARMYSIVYIESHTHSHIHTLTYTHLFLSLAFCFCTCWSTQEAEGALPCSLLTSPVAVCAVVVGAGVVGAGSFFFASLVLV